MGDKTPPGVRALLLLLPAMQSLLTLPPPQVIRELFGVPDEQYPHMFKPCIAGGLIGLSLQKHAEWRGAWHLRSQEERVLEKV